VLTVVVAVMDVVVVVLGGGVLTVVVTDVNVTNDVDGGSVTMITFVTVVSAVASTAANALRCCSVIMVAFPPTAPPMMAPITVMIRMAIIIRYLWRWDCNILALALAGRSGVDVLFSKSTTPCPPGCWPSA